MSHGVLVLYLAAHGSVLDLVCFFFFKQKTAYGMRISDWSSDVSSSDLWMVAPPLPITSRILSGLILIVEIRGANGDSCERGVGSTCTICSRMPRRAVFACVSACAMVSPVMPATLLSI